MEGCIPQAAEIGHLMATLHFTCMRRQDPFGTSPPAVGWAPIVQAVRMAEPDKLISGASANPIWDPCGPVPSNICKQTSHLQGWGLGQMPSPCASQLISPTDVNLD